MFTAENLFDEEKQLPGNIGLAIWRLKSFYETIVQGSTAVIRLNFCTKNPPHRQAENRCLTPLPVCHHGQYFVDLYIKLAKCSWRHEQWHKTLWRFNQIKTDWKFRNKYLVLKKCGLTNEFRYMHYNHHKQ